MPNITLQSNDGMNFVVDVDIARLLLSERSKVDPVTGGRNQSMVDPVPLPNAIFKMVPTIEKTMNPITGVPESVRTVGVLPIEVASARVLEKLIHWVTKEKNSGDDPNFDRWSAKFLRTLDAPTLFDIQEAGLYFELTKLLLHISRIKVEE